MRLSFYRGICSRFIQPKMFCGTSSRTFVEVWFFSCRLCMLKATCIFAYMTSTLYFAEDEAEDSD